MSRKAAPRARKGQGRARAEPAPRALVEASLSANTRLIWAAVLSCSFPGSGQAGLSEGPLPTALPRVSECHPFSLPLGPVSRRETLGRAGFASQGLPQEKLPREKADPSSASPPGWPWARHLASLRLQIAGQGGLGDWVPRMGPGVAVKGSRGCSWPGCAAHSVPYKCWLCRQQPPAGTLSLWLGQEALLPAPQVRAQVLWFLPTAPAQQYGGLVTPSHV